MTDDPVGAIIDTLQVMDDHRAIFESDASDPVGYATQAEGPMTRTIARMVGVSEENVTVRSMDLLPGWTLNVRADVLMPATNPITIAISKYPEEKP